ncbi:hypothetical protein PtA15_3A142 [Puccinia triticina]|uniref:Uncharacterized protein n=1 Tax=Puccinia triticina TaxID=208348 RepID=A0ABY7CC29_9BASI|nr:uncharacterized protein PtA15_3A142 [Puccinia triticina]WAQ82778.1 hypothetical protein PtA15_3A142 [Puccinia triticina]
MKRAHQLAGWRRERHMLPQDDAFPEDAPWRWSSTQALHNASRPSGLAKMARPTSPTSHNGMTHSLPEHGLNGASGPGWQVRQPPLQPSYHGGPL